MNNFQITDKQAGQRLDKFLVAKLPDLSRSQVQKAIKDGQVTINGKQPMVHRFLKVGDMVLVRTENREQRTGNREQGVVDIPIIKQADDYVVLNKPAGLVVHPVSSEDIQPSVVSFLLQKFPLVSKVGEDPLRPGIMHRLDKDVSGLMVAALTQEMFEHLKRQFKLRQVKKEYLALVYGEVAKDEGEIKFDIGWSRRNRGKLVARPATGQEQYKDKAAITYFWVEKRFKNYTLLRLQLKTGRTHQLRLHLQAFGHPVVGDRLYARKENQRNKFKLDKIFLQACNLEFIDLQGGRQKFALMAPLVFKNALSRL